MASIDGMDGLGVKLLALLLAFALIPMVSIGLVSIIEMNHASQQVQDKIYNLSTALNRSALNAASTEADQVQLAKALASQYNEFFKRIEAENEILADYMARNYGESDCPPPPGMWIAPVSTNESITEKRSATIRSLCVPAKMMERIVDAERAISLSYIGTEDGVLITWPYGNETLSRTAPFDYKDRPYYETAKSRKQTVWSVPQSGDKISLNATCTTPIFRGSEFLGVSGVEVSLASIYNDLSTIKGRGYPFIIDNSGRVVMQPASRPKGALNSLFSSDNLSEENNTEVRELIARMMQGQSSFSIIGLPEGDIYVAFAPVSSVGWSLGMAYPAEDMSLPARFIDSGIKEVAESATAGVNDAFGVVREFALFIFLLTVMIAAAIGMRLSQRVDDQIDAVVEAAGSISRGDFDIQLRPLAELAPIGFAISKMSRDLKMHSAKLKDELERCRRSAKPGMEIEEVKRELVPVHMPRADDYEIESLYIPSDRNGFDFYDIFAVEDKVALSMAGVGGEGTRAAILAVMARALIRASCKQSNPGQAMYELNANINEHAKGTHLACFFGLLDPQDHTLEYVNAGFNPPFIVDSGGMVDTLGGGGIALGMLDKMEQRPTRIPLQPGDVLIMYSNGVTEASNGNEEQFGMERLIDLVKKHRELSASDIISAVEDDFRGFVKDQIQDADFALVVLKQRPSVD